MPHGGLFHTAMTVATTDRCGGRLLWSGMFFASNCRRLHKYCNSREVWEGSDERQYDREPRPSKDAV
jgi:hypothetical protein